MTTYYDERRKDRAAERSEDRADRREREELRAKRQAEADERRRREEREHRRETERRKAERRERHAAARARLAGEGDTAAALIVMGCSIAPAFYFQVSALAAVPGLPGIIAVCLAVMLEAGAWVATVAGERAKREGRPVGHFRAAMWGCAAVAAWINYSHAPSSPNNWLAYVLAAASLGGVFFWELRGRGRHGGKAGRTRAERREAAARRRHGIARRLRFRDVHKRYRQILTAHPYGTVAPEQAWADAWTDVKGGPLATDAGSIGRRVEAARSVENVLAEAGVTPESAAVEMFLADLFASTPGDDGPTDETSVGGPQGGPDGTGGTGADRTSARTAGEHAALGRKGKHGTGDPSAKAPVRALDPTHLATVRRLADELGGPEHLSIAKIRKAGVGGNDRYLSALRDTVQGKAEGEQ